MDAILYLPGQQPQKVSAEGLSLSDNNTGYAQISERVSTLLECSAGLVDVLASGPHYVAYSVFDYEGEVNQAAMLALSDITRVPFNLDDDDAILQGPVLVIRSA